MNLEAVKKELECNSKYVESGISFDEVTVIQDGEYLQIAKSGFNLYVALISSKNRVYFYADEDMEELEVIETPEGTSICKDNKPLYLVVDVGSNAKREERLKRVREVYSDEAINTTAD